MHIFTIRLSDIRSISHRLLSHLVLAMSDRYNLRRPKRLEPEAREQQPTFDIKVPPDACGQDVMPARRVVFWLIIAGLSASFSIWWRQAKINVGYCDAGEDVDLALPVWAFPVWTNAFVPQCEPCPEYADCYPSLNIGCKDGFIPKQNPLSLGGLIPLSSTCVPDTRKAQHASHIATQILWELRRVGVQWECTSDKGQERKLPGISEFILKQIITKKHSNKIGEDGLNGLWEGAVQELTSKGEIMREDTDNGRLLTPTHLSMTRAEFVECAFSGLIHQPMSQESAALFIIPISIALMYMLRNRRRFWKINNTLMLL